MKSEIAKVTVASLRDLITRTGFGATVVEEKVLIVQHTKCRYSVSCRIGADGQSVENIQFRAAWATSGVNFHFVNEWNYRNRFTKLYLDDRSDPIIEFDVVTVAIAEAHLEECLGLWHTSLDNFLPK
ncbi:MAG TPA: YbjN domain-containing protein [Caulobacterales bacterium]|nr:YbjN domain-containing protein [Caulobacterales bacterium]